MKLSFAWIKDFIALDVDAFAAAKGLTMSGIEVEDIAPSIIPACVVAAEILEVSAHPNADKLSLCTVNAGQGPVQVVCGAPNVRVGLKSAYAPEGADLGNGLIVKKAKIRGVESFGILLSEKELGLTDDHTGIMEIEGQVKPGESLLERLNLADHVLDINITPNRGDCLSVIGIARELAAIFSQELINHPLVLPETDDPIEKYLTVEILARDACPRYCARMLKDVTIRKSPFLMRRRLFQSGVRAISNVVDITNYVMLELGQPLHAFDYRQIAGAAIKVRMAGDNERFTTLDENERVLNSGDLLICDAERPVALAGIMGGLNSEVKDDSQMIALESAYFTPVGIQRTARRLGLPSEAAYRFERGIDPEIQARAADRAAELMAELAGAHICRGLIDCDHRNLAAKNIVLRRGMMTKVLGLDVIPDREVSDILTRLGCAVAPTEGGWNVCAPALRHDLEREIDLIEEFIRIYGMDKIAPELPVYRPETAASDTISPRDIRLRLAAMGMTEIVTYSFIAPLWRRWFGAEVLELKNPISDELKLMRTSLIPGLASTVAKNKNLQTRDLAVFELGRCFLPQTGAKLPSEEERLAVAISGQQRDLHWSETRKTVDFYDIKGIAEALLPEMELKPSRHECLKSGYQADIILKGQTIGRLGQLHPDILGALDIIDEVYVLEISLKPLILKQFSGLKPIARFPMTWRDLSLIADEGLHYREIEQAVLKLGIRELKRVMPIDCYSGDKLEKGKKGITIRMIYQAEDRTLEDKQINTWQDMILHALEKGLGATLRQS
ncbi:MAG: phenylalanine--tRNA ligase subunit beta [Syntrophaceae bacterium]